MIDSPAKSWLRWFWEAGFSIRLDGSRLAVGPSSRVTSHLDGVIRRHGREWVPLLQDGAADLVIVPEERFPADLPHYLEYCVGKQVFPTLPRREIENVNGVTNARVVHPRIPVGCTGWRRPPQREWKPLAELPPEWLPFLERGNDHSHP